MTVELHEGLLVTQQLPASRLLVLDRHGNPLVAILELDDNVVVSLRGDPSFETVLDYLGRREGDLVTRVVGTPSTTQISLTS